MATRFLHLLTTVGSISLLSSCAIYLDKPHEERFTGRVKYSDGRPAKKVTVTMRSPRDYFPLLLMLAPHQPLALYASSQTDQKGYYSFDAHVSRGPVITAMTRSDDPEEWQSQFMGGTRDIKDGIIILKTREEDVLCRDIKLENRPQ